MNVFFPRTLERIARVIRAKPQIMFVNDSEFNIFCNDMKLFLGENLPYLLSDFVLPDEFSHTLYRVIDVSLEKVGYCSAAFLIKGS